MEFLLQRQVADGFIQGFVAAYFVVLSALATFGQGMQVLDPRIRPMKSSAAD